MEQATARETDGSDHGALRGIRVVELATVVAGPGAGRYLADFGAEVIKVEGPGGDPTRRMGWTGEGEADSYFWKLVNRNKQAVVLDLKTEDGKNSLWSLLLDADVLIENMRPGKLEALGFGPEELLRRNPKLVILRVTGFGQDGPYALHPGFATIAEAMSGFSGLLGEADGPPLLPPIAMTDEVTALVGAFATMVALRHAERTGEGQTIDVNLLNSMFQIRGRCRPLTLTWATCSHGSAPEFPTPFRAAPIVAPTRFGWRSQALPIPSRVACWFSSALATTSASRPFRRAAATVTPWKPMSPPGSRSGRRRRCCASSAASTPRSPRCSTCATFSPTSIFAHAA